MRIALIEMADPIAHVAGCDEPGSCAQKCDIAFQITHDQDGCECLNMARAAAMFNSDHLLELLDAREPIAFDGVSGSLVECWVDGGECRRTFRGNTIAEAARAALGLDPESGDRGENA